VIETRMLTHLERLLDVTAARQRIVVENIANVDTPGYRTRDLDFRAALSEAGSLNALEVRGLVERPDGNNVDLDREGLLVAANQMQYRLGTQLLRTEFRRILSAIQETR